jgi:hypothetical protein
MIHKKQINTMIRQNVKFLCEFAELRKATLSFVVAVVLSDCLSVGMEQLFSPLTDFHKT